MTEQQAYRRAQTLANRKQREYFVVWSVEETDAPREHYHVSNEYDLDGYYLGAEVVTCIEPNTTRRDSGERSSCARS